MRASYPTYKPTSIPWPDRIPSTWELVKISSVFRERRETVSDKDFAPLSVTMQGIVPQLETAAKTDNGDNRKMVCKGDFVINSRSDRKGSAGISPLDGSVSVISIVLKPSKKLHERYVDYLLTNYYFQEEFYRYGKGIVADLWSTKYSSMKGMFIPLPSIEEQTAIANYLEAKTEQINRFIEKKQKLIGLLKEQKRSLTTELIQEEAKNVEKIKLKYCVRNVSVQTSQMAKDDIYLGMENVESWTGLYVESEQKDFESQAKMFQFNDVLFGKLRPYLAKVFLANIKGVCSGEFLVLRPSKKIAPEYLQLVLLDPEFISLVNSSTFGAKMPRADWGFIGNQLISIPSIAQQKQIVAMIKSEGETIDKVIGRIEKEIEKVKELKQSLIAEAVTGKIKIS